MTDTTKALVSLSPAPAKRLIGRAVARDPEVLRAAERGVLIVTLGTTNAFLVNELLDGDLPPLSFAAGAVQCGRLCPTPASERARPLVMVGGVRSELRPAEALEQAARQHCVVVKGGNAIDPAGRVGVLLAAPDGGTVGRLLGRIRAAGHHLLAPIGLEKLVPDVPDACRSLGQKTLKRSRGARCGMMELVGARAFTEVDALFTLTGVSVRHVASGGVCGSEGAVTLLLEGTDEGIAHASELLDAIEDTPSISEPLRTSCERCRQNCDFAGSRPPDAATKEL